MSPDSTLESKPVRALAGAADAAVSGIRDLSVRVADAVSDEQFRADVRRRFEELTGRVSSAVSDENVRADVRQRVAGLPAEARTWGEDLPAFFKQLPEKAAGLSDRAREAFTWERRHELMTQIPARVREVADQATQQASRTYDDFAGRGAGVVTRLKDEYEHTLGDRVVAIRGRVADAADDVADAADKVADDLKEHQQ
ncbi:hypothetical protein [Phytoactinopolyspora halotolerans]|uniref:Heparin-binding hemagglutinin n=1 Tax=Phytoactinopolyspora halotolerans TaxID=1981512 RepID=A0A6L9S3S2_9ACTN|nr:hypothetical protein [Phytoactinopolyspora halotolerans]NED99480.1 hypothetical protein [Phytoactinopolyspora halotolerans]